MKNLIKKQMLLALEKKYEAQIAEAKTTLMIYLENPVGIGEHPQHLEEMNKLIEKMSSAQDKLNNLKDFFSDKIKIIP